MTGIIALLIAYSGTVLLLPFHKNDLIAFWSTIVLTVVLAGWFVHICEYQNILKRTVRFSFAEKIVISTCRNIILFCLFVSFPMFNFSITFSKTLITVCSEASIGLILLLPAVRMFGIFLTTVQYYRGDAPQYGDMPEPEISDVIFIGTTTSITALLSFSLWGKYALMISENFPIKGLW